MVTEERIVKHNQTWRAVFSAAQAMMWFVSTSTANTMLTPRLELRVRERMLCMLFFRRHARLCRCSRKWTQSNVRHRLGDDKCLVNTLTCFCFVLLGVLIELLDHLVEPILLDYGCHRHHTFAFASGGLLCHFKVRPALRKRCDDALHKLR